MGASAGLFRAILLKEIAAGLSHFRLKYAYLHGDANDEFSE
jgi:hypothetical protein